MESVFCKDINTININPILDNQYTFLKGNKYYNTNKIYNIINNQEEFKIKNLYRYIYSRIYKIHTKYSNIKKMKLHKTVLTPKIFNTLLCEYIKNNILYEIIIVNSIIFYYYPSNY